MDYTQKTLAGLVIAISGVLGTVFALLVLSSASPVSAGIQAAAITSGSATLSNNTVDVTGVEYAIIFTTATEITANVTGGNTTSKFELVFAGSADLSSVTTAASGSEVSLLGLGTLTQKDNLAGISGDSQQYYVEVTSPVSGSHTLSVFLHRQSPIPSGTSIQITVDNVGNGPVPGTFNIAVTTEDDTATTVDGPTNIPYTLAAPAGEVSGSFNVGADPTTITAVSLTSMTPQVTTTLTISVQDADLLTDTQSIEVNLLFDPGDIDPNDATISVTGSAVDTKATFTWSKASPFSTSAFVLTGPTSSTWSVVSTTNPGDGSGTSGDFVLQFTPGEVAAFGIGGPGNDGWDIHVEVTDSTSSDVASANTGVGTSSLADRAMGAFASVSVDPTSVSFGTLTSNSSGNPITTPGDGDFATTAISNKTHELAIQSSATWTDGTTTLNLDVDGSPGTNTLSLRADDEGNVGLEQFLTASAAAVNGHSTDARDTTEAGTTVDISVLLDLGTVVASGNPFEGTITMTVVN